MRARCHGCTVWRQDFLALDLPPNVDGVFANAFSFTAVVRFAACFCVDQRH